MKLLDTKAGKRVRTSMVDLLNQAIDNLHAVVAWAKYEDDVVETDEKASRNFPSATIGDIERSRTQLTRRPSSGGGGVANWSAKVGEIIIGNLMRGEGGRFASARNIANMMRQLDDAGITPDMFTSMQSLLAGTGKKISGEVMGYLRSAGLVNDQGVVQSKANDIVNAIKTGDPTNLKKVLKPPSGGGGGGGTAKLSEEEKERLKKEKEAKYVEELRGDITARTKLTDKLIDDLLAFFDGGEIDAESLSTLMSMGLLAKDADGNIFVTSNGKSFVTNLRAGDLRDALDSYSRAINSAADGDEEVDDQPSTKTAENIAKVSKVLVEREEMAQEDIDSLLAFDRGEDVEDTDMATLVGMGLANISSNGGIYMTLRGQQLVTRLESGDTRDALDAIARAREEVRKRRDVAKTTRASVAERLIDDGDLTRAQADALIRTWINRPEDIDPEAIDELNAMGLMAGNQLSPFGILLLQAMDNNNIDVAQDFIDRALGNLEKSYHGMKQLGGKYFLTWTTNAFKDREGEIFTTDAIERYLAQDEKGDTDYGTYNFWHIPGTEFAKVVWRGGVGRFMVEIGEFDDTPMGRSFKAFFDRYPDGHPEMAPYGWGCSHEYVYSPLDRQDGVYDQFEKFRSTVLPLQEAANPFTLSEFGLGEKAMKLSEKQRQGLLVIAKEIGDPNLVDDIERIGNERTEILEKSGFQFKARGVCKREDGVCYPASDYAYVEDAETPSTWKLRLTEGEPGNVTVAQLGRAAAAFSRGGFRGNRVELPQDKVGPVKNRIRAQYRKLGVSDEDIPESIKMAKDETMDRKEIARKMEELSAEMPQDVKEEWDTAAGEIATDPVSDVEALQRLLMELVAELPDETRAQAEELIVALSQLATPPVVEDVAEDEMVEEEVVEEEMPVEDVATEEALVEEETAMSEDEEEDDELTIESDGEMKALSEKAIQSVVEALHLEQLSGLLEQQASALKGTMSAIDELVGKFKSLDERIGELEGSVKGIADLETKVAEAKEDVKSVRTQTEAIVGEKQRWVPFWMNGVASGSVAREETLSESEQKEYRKPEVPSVIANIRNRMLNSN